MSASSFHQIRKHWLNNALTNKKRRRGNVPKSGRNANTLRNRHHSICGVSGTDGIFGVNFFGLWPWKRVR